MSRGLAARVVAAVLLVGAPAALPVPASAAAPSKASAAGHGAVTEARFGGGRGFGLRSRPRYSYPRGSYPRYRTRGLERGIVRGLGIAFLLHALFGYGTGGSPIGLLLVFGVILWLVSRRRRRGRFAY